MPKAQAAAAATAPNPIAMLFHVFKSMSLAVSLLVDPRVHPARKAVFITVIGALIAAAVGVEGIGEAVTQVLNIFPGLGVFIGAGEIPVDVTVDWVLVAAALFNLLRLFPREIVGEHYDRLFRSRQA
ncbi:MAG TPA: hypothetical protein VGR57_07395 [Ktedonobacterales bacterium]|nr:hypothetical protein [Ktedonobacterales bacterium]